MRARIPDPARVGRPPFATAARSVLQTKDGRASQSAPAHGEHLGRRDVCVVWGASRTRFMEEYVMCQFHPRNPIHCIVPPHILRKVAESGTPAQREVAQRALSVDETLRALRAARRPDLMPTPPARMAQAAQKQRSIFTASNAQTLPGTLVRSEGQGASGDVGIDEAYDG